MKYLWMPWRRAFDFSGRSTRREYWTYVATFPVAMFVYLLIIALIFPERPGGVADSLVPLVSLLLVLAGSLVGLSAGVRRLHDHNESGWFILLSLVPFIGWIFYLLMMLAPGTNGPNSYGEDPRKPHADLNEVARVFS